ncbi:hypothetical protein D3C78_1746310 [compost metagenome]
MARQGLDLANYGVEVNHAGNIYQQVAAGIMLSGQPWSPDWVGKRSQAKWCREWRATLCG